jgi:hypothetical protein
MVIEAGFVEHIVPLLGNEDYTIVKAALEAVENIAMGTDEHIQEVLNKDALKYLVMWLSKDDQADLQFKAARALANISMGPHTAKQSVVLAGLFIFLYLKNH